VVFVIEGRGEIESPRGGPQPPVLPLN